MLASRLETKSGSGSIARTHSIPLLIWLLKESELRYTDIP